jgi:cytidylate kinase
MGFVVAIDGPAGAGKSTIARRVAAALGLAYLDTGAMYRAVAWKALRDGVDMGSADALERCAASLDLAFRSDEAGGSQRVTVDVEDVTDAIRTPEISQWTSKVSAMPGVRRIVVAMQRALGERSEKGVVLEGRDTGSVVFPGADVKIFLTASPERRAERRFIELEKLGIEVDYAAVLEDQKERDARDSGRADSPLVVAPGAEVLDTDALTIDQVVDAVLAACERRTRTER